MDILCAIYGIWVRYLPGYIVEICRDIRVLKNIICIKLSIRLTSLNLIDGVLFKEL